MAKKILIVIVALVLIIAMGGWLAYYFSDKEVIKRQLTGLAVELGKEGQESPIQMALKMGNVKKMLAKGCLVTIPEKGYSEVLEQDLIIQYLIYHRNRFALFTVAFEDVIVDIPVKGQATVQSRVRLRRQNTAQIESVEESHQVEIALIQSDKKWLFHKVTMPESLVE
ncbi:MAG: hypothetical protein NTY00_02565 [Deltaproteobacteria bacterium]|nr:hypothetical protein [Deltaproteobacteria bacterium]